MGRRAAAILVLFLPVLLAAGLGIGAGWAASQLIRVPKVEQLASYRPDIVTEIRGADGTIVARFAIERRFLVTRAQIPDVLVKAVLAAEDARFFDHGGVDIIRIGGAALRDLATRRLEQGASTITQQLAKLVFLTPEKSFARKINEVFLTVEIEKRYSKDQILTMYLNQVYLGHGNYGVEAASKWYFDRPAKELTLPQAALLAGLIQRPEAYSPIRNPSAAKARRDLVLRRMLEERYVDDRAAASAREAPLGLSRSAREATIGPYFCEEVRQYLEKAYGDRGLYRQGLRVDSTLDPRLQAWAEEELRRGLRRHERRFGFRKPRNLADDGIDPEKYHDPEWEEPVAPGDAPSAERAVVLSAGRTGAELRVRDRRFTLPPRAFRFTRAESPAQRRAAGRPRPRGTAGGRGGEGRDDHLAGAGRGGRRGRSRKRYGRRPRPRRRLRLLPLEVQPGRPGAPPGRICVQADRLHDRRRSGPHSRRHRPRLADLDHHRLAPGPVEAAELHPQVRRNPHVPVRPRELDQRPGGPRRPPRRDPEGHRDRPPPRHPPEPPRLSVARARVVRSQPDGDGDRLFRPREPGPPLCPAARGEGPRRRGSPPRGELARPERGRGAAQPRT